MIFEIMLSMEVDNENKEAFKLLLIKALKTEFKRDGFSIDQRTHLYSLIGRLLDYTHRRIGNVLHLTQPMNGRRRLERWEQGNR